MRFSVSDAGIWYGNERLAPRDALLADTRELAALGTDDGVKHLHMPHRIDIIFAAGSSVVGCESKRAQDFINSFYSRRLHRQLRTLRQVVDVPVVILRGFAPDFIDDYREAIINLVRIQALGVYLLPLPDDDRECLPWLLKYREILTEGTRAAHAAVAGSDNRLKGSGLLVSRVKGLGAKRVDGLLRLAVSGESEAELAKVVGKSMAKKLKEAVE